GVGLKLLDTGRAHHGCIVAVFRIGRGGSEKTLWVVGYDPDMAIRMMLEVVADAFLSQQAFDEFQGGLVVLHAISARLIAAGQFKTIGARINAGFVQQFAYNIGYR